MAEPKLQIEQRMDRVEEAIETMAEWLVQAQTGFNANDAQGIKRILRGEKRDASQESGAEEMGVRSEGPGMGEGARVQQQGTPSEESNDQEQG